MSLLESALDLARRGFFVFPLAQGTKDQPIVKFKEQATRDEVTIRRWWTCPVTGFERGYNIGIYAGKYLPDEEGVMQALVIVDIDLKEKKNGFETAEYLDLVEGKTLSPTFSQNSASGGKHCIYRWPVVVKQGESVLGNGLDIRSSGGYVVGSGSALSDGREYSIFGDLAVEVAPQWVIDECGKIEEKVLEVVPDIDDTAARRRAVFYLEHDAPLAIEGTGGDQCTFVVAARLKDIGVDESVAFEVMNEFWNVRCIPPWHPDELKGKVENAYQYGSKAQGSDAPEAHFDAVPEKKIEPPKHPFDKLNDEYAFVIAGGGHHILWETKDSNGNFRLEHLSENTFHRKLAAKKMSAGGKKNGEEAITKLWMDSERRRSFEGMCFKPGKVAPEGWYNLWRGFSVEPVAKIHQGELHESVQKFLEHAKQNVCAGDESLYRWLIGYFAHLVQKPWEKPLVALVLKGLKGVGKNALLDCIGHLLGNHYLLTSDRRYLVGNFNGHLENNLLLVLDEAFWSGDKQSEGTLKSLITSRTHNIEHKGKEIYTVDNCSRVVILGNEDWLVPATHDERRFAVFNVGDSRRQDRDFFRGMREGMEAGGYAHLLRYLLDFDLTGIDVNAAPATEGLLEQKLSSLDTFDDWWYQCLNEGRVVGTDISDDWPVEVPRGLVRDSLLRYARERNIRSRMPDESTIGKRLARCAPSIYTTRPRRGDSRVRLYHLGSLEECRADWEKHIGHRLKWEKDE